MIFKKPFFSLTQILQYQETKDIIRLEDMSLNRELPSAGEVFRRKQSSEGLTFSPQGCDGLNVCIPPNSDVEALTPRVMVYGRGAFRRSCGRKGRGCVTGFGSL